MAGKKTRKLIKVKSAKKNAKASSAARVRPARASRKALKPDTPKKAAARPGKKGKGKKAAPRKGAAGKGIARGKGAAKASAKSASRPRSVRRRDATGHLDPKYAADLRRRSAKKAESVGFIGETRSNDDLAEALAEQFVETATTGEDVAEERMDEQVPEERGGPFVRSNAGVEFAEGTDASNPKGSKREPFPTT